MLGQLSSPDLGQLWSQLEDVSYRVSEFYQKTAPAVSEWAEFLFARKAEQITWAEIMFIVDLDITSLGTLQVECKTMTFVVNKAYIWIKILLF